MKFVGNRVVPKKKLFYNVNLPVKHKVKLVSPKVKTGVKR